MKMQATFEVNGGAYATDDETLALLRQFKEAGNNEMFGLVFELGKAWGRIAELPPTVRVENLLLQARFPVRFQTEGLFADWLNQNPDLCPDGGHDWYDYEGFEGDGYGLALLTSEPRLIDDVDSLARYFFEGPFAGEYYGTTSPDAVDGVGRLFFLNTDFTKSRHDDWTDYIHALWPLLRDGTAIRKTDRAGSGTKGTRAVEGLGCGLWVAFR